MADIKRNLVFLSKNITNLPEILLYLIQEDVISDSERERIKIRESSLERNEALLTLMERKDWEQNRKLFLEILRNTGNKHCADIIEDARQGDRNNYSEKSNESSEKQAFQQLWFEVPSPSILYTGREKEMELLQRYWNNCLNGNGNGIFSIVAVTGLGGIGKSELAKNFAKWFYINTNGHCIWILAENSLSVVKSFETLAEFLKISLKDNLGQERNFYEIVGEVYEKLFGEKVLIVFDNIENYELPVLSLLFSLSSGRPPTMLKPLVITTSRFCEYSGSQCHYLDLQILSKPSAMEFFQKSLSLNELPSESFKELIEKLCQRLQYFPLAMLQATAYIKERILFGRNAHEVITNYLTQMEKQSKALLNYRLPQYEALGDISKSTLLTWKITFEKLRNSNELTIDVMNIISFLSPNSIPTKIVIKILQKMGKVSDAAHIDNFFELIRKYSLINFANEKLISVHRLVQEVTRIELEEIGNFRTLLNEIAKAMCDMLIAEEIGLKELVHAQMLWQHLKVDKELMGKHEELPGLICNKFLSSGKYRDLLEFSIESRNFIESVFGQNHRMTLQIQHWNGVALSELGEYEDSLKVLTDTYQKQKEAFGEENGDCLMTAGKVGTACYLLRKYDQALTIFTKTLEKRERLYGQESIWALGLKNNIAVVLNEQNKLDESVKLYEEILKAYERLLEVDDLNIVTTRSNIACIKIKQKEYSRALKEFKEILELQERILELNHPKTLVTKHSIAVAYHCLGKDEESLQLLKEVHETRVQTLGRLHPETVRTAEAIDKVKTVIALLSYLNTQFSSISSEIPQCMNNVLRSEEVPLKYLFNVQNAWQHLKKNEEMVKKGVKLPSWICKTLLSSEKYTDLLSFSSESAELFESVLGPDSRFTLIMKFWNGKALRKVGNTQLSLEVLQDVLKNQVNLFREEAEDWMTTANEMGSVFYDFDMFESALMIYTQTLENRERISGKEHPETLAVKYNIANVLIEQNNYEKAAEIYKEVLVAQESVFGMEHACVLNTKCSIAIVKLRKNEHGEALKEFKKVLEVQERVLESKHVDILRTKDMIALTYYALGRHEESLPLYKELYEIRVQAFGLLHPETIRTKDKIERVTKHIEILESLTADFTKCIVDVLKAEATPMGELTQLQIIWQRLKRDKEIKEDDGKHLVGICTKLFNSKKCADLLAFGSESAELLTSALGQNNPWTLQIRYWKGRALKEFGQFSGSLELLKDVYQNQRSIFREEGKDCLETANQIGSLYLQLGRCEEAMSTFNTVLEKSEKVFGKEHLRTLAVKHNMALVLGVQNKFTEAMEIYKEVLEIEERLLGVEHTSTLTTRTNIACIKLYQKDYPVLKMFHEIMEQLVRREIPFNSIDICNTASGIFDRSDYSQALNEFQEVLEIQERVLKFNHPNILQTKYFIAVTYHYLGRDAESLFLFKEVHESRSQILGPRHPETIMTKQLIKKLEIENALQRFFNDSSSESE